MKLSERIHQWGIACESPTLFGFANEVAQLEAENKRLKRVRDAAKKIVSASEPYYHKAYLKAFDALEDALKEDG